MSVTEKSCLIIGAGLAGLTAATELHEAGWRVQLLDKSRGVGGRMATRRIDQSRFDHGAQFFTVRDPRFQIAVDKWLAAGWARPWFTEGGHVRYCGAQGMNGIAKELAKPFDIKTEATAAAVHLADDGWHVITQDGAEHSAKALILTPPAAQTLVLLSNCLDALPAALVTSLQATDYDPCFALMVTLDGPSNVPEPGYVRPAEGPISFIADNTRKGISSGMAALTIHATPDFSRANFDENRDEIARTLTAAANAYFGSELLTWQLHRWKFSQPVRPSSEPCLFAGGRNPLVIAGDGFGGSRIEGAFLSGLAAANRLKS